jgi:hypothetical protein
MGRPSECSCHCTTTSTTTTTTTQPPATSACCVGTSCFELSSTDCASSSGTWYSGQACGDIDCGTTPPPTPTGSCCTGATPDGASGGIERTCIDDVTESMCGTIGGWENFNAEWTEGGSCSFSNCQAFFTSNFGTNNCGFEKWREKDHSSCVIESVGGGVNDECICDTSVGVSLHDCIWEIYSPEKIVHMLTKFNIG